MGGQGRGREAEHQQIGAPHPPDSVAGPDGLVGYFDRDGCEAQAPPLPVISASTERLSARPPRTSSIHRSDGPESANAIKCRSPRTAWDSPRGRSYSMQDLPSARVCQVRPSGRPFNRPTAPSVRCPFRCCRHPPCPGAGWHRQPSLIPCRSPRRGGVGLSDRAVVRLATARTPAGLNRQ